MTPARIAFVVAGVAGMLLIVQPGTDVFHGASLFALVAAIFYASYQIMTRMLAGENPRVLLFYPALIGHGDPVGAAHPASTGRPRCRGRTCC